MKKNMLTEDNGKPSYIRIIGLMIIFYTMLIGVMLIHYGYPENLFEVMITGFSMALFPKVFQKIIEKKYGGKDEKID